MIAIVLCVVFVLGAFAALRHACSPRQTYPGRHHVEGAY